MQLKIVFLSLLLPCCGGWDIPGPLPGPLPLPVPHMVDSLVNAPLVFDDAPVNALAPALRPSVEHVLANDVSQGSNGDCWANAVFAALALRHAGAITDAIKDTSDPNTWQVRLYDLATRQTHYYTVQAPFNDPLANRVVNNVRWPAILQAAFVAYNDETGHLHHGLKGYRGINGGRSEWAFKMLLPGDSWAIPFPNNDVAFAVKIRENHPLVVPHWHSTDPRLVPEHVYTLMRVTPDNAWVTVRNPRGVGGDDGKGMLTLPNNEVRTNFWGIVFGWPP